MDLEPIIRTLTGIAAGVCMGRSVLGMFAPQPKRWKRILVYLLLGIAIVLPSWVGDENPILFFPFFILGFLLLLPGNKLPKLVVGGIFYTLLIPINMLMDSQYWNNTMLMVTLLCKALAWCGLALFLFRLVPKGDLRLSKRLWLLLGGLTLAPLMAMMSFSIWGNNFKADVEYQLYFTILQRFGYTILPFVMISALTLLIAAVVLSRHEALEQESRLSALREVYYTGLKQEQTGLRTLRHDLRNHVTALRCRLDKGVFMLQVQNAMVGEANIDLSTTKADAKQHGYGLVGMRKIATRHGEGWSLYAAHLLSLRGMIQRKQIHLKRLQKSCPQQKLYAPTMQGISRLFDTCCI